MTVDERVVIVDADNRPVDVVPRSVMRAKGLCHRVTGVFVLDREGRLFVQRRTETKDVYPGMLDLCAGGVVVAGESYEECAEREAAEELGIVDAPLETAFDSYFCDPGPAALRPSEKHGRQTAGEMQPDCDAKPRSRKPAALRPSEKHGRQTAGEVQPDCDAKPRSRKPGGGTAVRNWCRVFICRHDGPFTLQPEEVASGEFVAIADILADDASRYTPDSLEALCRLLAGNHL